MALRIRCPQCRTIQRVPAGIRPVCPKCGYAGNSAPAGEAPTADAWAQAEAENVSWETAPAEGDAPQADAWAPAEGESVWGEAEPADAPKKKGWFSRSK